ncbi:DEAD/DEAH box helicase [Paenibacillus beijingensis]|uniref:DEAD/DEAH box helicase n=1 Tax=Paenibacillus beijingensis TaxID=1126833 RepID=UPI0006974047|nr:helicase-related protein [Paenibacillus beijingensis]
MAKKGCGEGAGRGMKGYVYVVLTKEGWRARFSIEPGIDLSYWLDEHFRATIDGEGTGRIRLEGSAPQLLLCKNALPLGAAYRAVELWEEKTARQVSAEDAQHRLAACVEAAELESGGARTARSGSRTAPQLRWVTFGARQSGGGGASPPAGQSAAAWRGNAAAGECGSPRVSLRSAAAQAERPGGSGTVAASAEAAALAAAARSAGAALRGRALLRGEVQALLTAGGGGAAGAFTAASAPWAGGLAAGATTAASNTRAGSKGNVWTRATWADGNEVAGTDTMGGIAPEGTEEAIGVALRAPLQLAALLGLLRLRSAVAVGAGRRRQCLRCGSGGSQLRRALCASCGRMCAYCEACITMGRSRECELLVLGVQVRPLHEQPQTAACRLPAAAERLRRWQLSPAQSDAAGQALHFIEHDASALTSSNSWKLSRSHSRSAAVQGTAAQSETCLPRLKLMTQAAEWAQNAVRRWLPLPGAGSSRYTNADQPRFSPQFLLWAVTGAGKTEMVFPLIESVLLRGGRALLATPRRDVVLELDPRIRKAFPHETVVTLYGGSEQRWESGSITLATTHQLFRFYQAFELVIIDELDAYPYHGDPMLHYAAAKACSTAGATLLLSATPPAELQRAARRGRLPYARVPVRFHRHPLPVPQTLRMPSVRDVLRGTALPRTLAAALACSVDRDAQLFVFVQQIRHVQPLVNLLQSVFAHLTIDGTFSSDPQRAEKVQRFRKREIRILVTTTILERGVTIPRSDIFILDADGRLFDEASLVQMAGRAGRSADDPHGRVFFCSPSRNRAQLAAIRQIRTMNRIARRRGYLLPQISPDPRS